MTVPDDLSQSMIQKIITTLKRYGVKKVILFGSYVRNEVDEGSDIDLLVDVPEETTLLDLGRMQRELTETLGVEVHIKELGGHPASAQEYARFINSIKDEMRVIYNAEEKS